MSESQGADSRFSLRLRRGRLIRLLLVGKHVDLYSFRFNRSRLRNLDHRRDWLNQRKASARLVLEPQELYYRSLAGDQVVPIQ